jgi:SAM-dependent methyltransferase
LGLICALVTLFLPNHQLAKSDGPAQINNLATPSEREAFLDPRQDEKKKDKDAQTKNAKTEDNPEPDVPYWPTPPTVVDKMLEMAEVKKGDVVYDLGCGDARILVAAAKKYGVKGFGFDIDPERVKESLDNVKKNKLEDLVTIKKADIFTLDLKDASVVTLYLMPELNSRLMPQLEKLKPGSRIVSHDWDMKGAKPKDVVSMRAKNAMGLERVHKVYLWVVPWEKE